jgi:pimeloyl-ACP methyl ester carboxylesterase
MVRAGACACHRIAVSRTLPPIVLVHGAFEGGWCWRRVAALLRAAGAEVVTPTLTGCGDRAHLCSRDTSLALHVQDVVATIETEDLRELVLVGHSYGGTVVTAAADAVASRIGHLVYLDASAPRSGQASTGAFAEGTADALAQMSGEDWLLPPLPLDAVGVTAPSDIAWVEPRRRPHPVRTLHEPVQLAHGDAPPFPRSYVRHTRNEAMVTLFGVDPLAPFAARAQAEGWGYGEIAAGHDAMITHPRDVAETLLKLIQC